MSKTVYNDRYISFNSYDSRSNSDFLNMCRIGFLTFAAFYLYTMKAVIKIVSAGKFTPDQEQIIKRIANVLVQHDLSVSIQRKVKKVETVKLKLSG